MICIEFSSSIPILNSCLRVKFATNIGFFITQTGIRHILSLAITIICPQGNV